MASEKNTNTDSSGKVVIEGLNVFYRRKCVLEDINLVAQEKNITCIIGPSGCGKSTLLMAINRLLDEIPHARISGEIKVRLEQNGFCNVLKMDDSELPQLRRQIGMVFQHPNILPMSILNNVAFPLKIMGLKGEKAMQKIARALRMVYLWDEVKDRLNSSAIELSGGQKQRLCLARVLVMEPEILLLDEPTSFLDQRLGEKIETLLEHLKKEVTLIVVSHYRDQVKRLADKIYRLG